MIVTMHTGRPLTTLICSLCLCVFDCFCSAFFSLSISLYSINLSSLSICIVSVSYRLHLYSIFVVWLYISLLLWILFIICLYMNFKFPNIYISYLPLSLFFLALSLSNSTHPFLLSFLPPLIPL